MATEAKQENLWQYAFCAMVLALGYMLWTKQPVAPGPKPEPAPAVSIERETKQILATIRSANAGIFLDAADRLEKGAIKTDKELFEFVRPATEAARKAANKPFDVALDLSLPRNEEGTFAGKEVEAAALLRKIARSW